MVEAATNVIDQITAGSTQARKAWVSDAQNEVEGHKLDVTHGLVQAQTVKFVEAGAATYTGTISLPAGAIIVDIIVHVEAVWAAGTSASLEVGDSATADGFFTAVDLKATDLVADESVNLTEKDGGVNGAYNTATHVTDRRAPAGATRDIVCTVVSVGAGTAGRTRVTVLYVVEEIEVTATSA